MFHGIAWLDCKALVAVVPSSSTCNHPAPTHTITRGNDSCPVGATISPSLNSCSDISALLLHLLGITSWKLDSCLLVCASMKPSPPCPRHTIPQLFKFFADTGSICFIGTRSGLPLLESGRGLPHLVRYGPERDPDPVGNFKPADNRHGRGPVACERQLQDQVSSGDNRLPRHQWRPGARFGRGRDPAAPDPHTLGPPGRCSHGRHARDGDDRGPRRLL